MLHRYWPGVAPTYEGKKRNAKERWDYRHRVFDEAIRGFETHLTDVQAQADSAEKAKQAREARKEPNELPFVFTNLDGSFTRTTMTFNPADKY